MFNRRWLTIPVMVLLIEAPSYTSGLQQPEPEKPPGPARVLRVRATEDFEITGDGRSPAWQKAEGQPLSRRGGKLPYETSLKMLYSKTGIYVLFEGTDKQVTATLTEDFQDLWKEDAFEVYLWPDERETLYFEYQISPLNKELILLIPNLDGKFLGWRPWHYEGNRKTRKAVSGVGGELRSGATITGWKAEVFFPYELLTPLRNVPPKSGTRWRGNFYRMDYDDGERGSWHWAPVGGSFHEFQKFGTLVFE
jgi:hypothetical protein